MQYVLVEVSDKADARQIAEEIEQGTDGVRAAYVYEPKGR